MNPHALPHIGKTGPEVPPAVCFRITRCCNARCGFCLAPAEETHPDTASLVRRIDWLLARGARKLMFCGGEPTLHPALPELLRHARARGAKTALTSNAIELPEGLLPVLHGTGTRVKVSLHGDRAHHDRLVGREAFHHTTRNLERLLAANIAVSIQTTVVAGGLQAVAWVADYCLATGVRRLGILPFIPRGRGREQRRQFALASGERRTLRSHVAAMRRALNGRLDVRWLDFTTRSIPVMDADGRLVLEGATESMDRVLYRLP